MAQTEERIKIKVEFEATYKFNGKQIDSMEIEHIKSDIKDRCLQGMYDAVDSQIGYEREDIDVVDEELITIEIKEVK